MFLELVILLVQLVELSVGLVDSLLPGFHFFDEIGVVFFGLEENVVEFGVGGFELACFFFELFKSVDRVIEKLVKTLTFVFVFCSLLF